MAVINLRSPAQSSPTPYAIAREWLDALTEIRQAKKRGCTQAVNRATARAKAATTAALATLVQR